MAEDSQKPLKIYVIAGEPSGDLLAGRLIAALREKADRKIEFFGVGGPRMAEEGLQSLFPMEELSVMGIAEILPRAYRLMQRMRETAAHVREIRPEAIVTVDAPAFCFGVHRRLEGFPATRIHYVAPTVWAWRPGRAEKFAKVFDRLLVLLPFEPPWFERVGLATDFVGHSVLESDIDPDAGTEFRQRNGIEPDTTLLCILPGSRRGEISRHLGIFGETAAMLGKGRRKFSVVIPTLPSKVGLVRQGTAGWSVPVTIVESERERYEAMAASDVALAASGTVALELARARTPSVIAYRIHPLTHLIVRNMVSVEYANLVNLLLDRPAVPEFLQGDCRADRLAGALEILLNDSEARQAQIKAYDQALSMLSNDGKAPSEVAADCVLDALGHSLPADRK